jgi:glucose/arabinose dehydrogenase
LPAAALIQVDVLVWHDGSLLVSDDKSDSVFRIAYNGS